LIFIVATSLLQEVITRLSTGSIRPATVPVPLDAKNSAISVISLSPKAWH
jgi:hypothetical protein